MTITVSGPMFWPSADNFRQSVFGRDGGHYNIFEAGSDKAMAFLRQWFKDGEANEFNFVLFSTSGVHGTYVTIEAIEESLRKYGESPTFMRDENEEEVPDDYRSPSLTFLIVQPRIVGMTYGNAKVTLDDIPFLKKLRESSWKVAQTIGKE